MTSKYELEEGSKFTPRFDAQGLIPCITQDAENGDILMFAFMNEQSLQKTIETGEVYYWSRSRGALWHKGATSGHVHRVVEIRTDCDQDCILVKVRPQASCHTGRNSCFYRKIESDGSLCITDGPVFDPKDVYS